MDENDNEYQQLGALNNDTECSHLAWMKRCSICRTVLESDSQFNFSSGKSSKILYDEISSSVCNYKIAMKLSSILPAMSTAFVWVEVIETGIITLRLRKKTIARGSRITPAYLSSELCELLHRSRKRHLKRVSHSKAWQVIKDPSKFGKLILKYSQ